MHRAALLVLSVLLSVGPPGVCAAFEFDGWRSGMALSEILAAARDRDLPIAPSSRVYSGRHYDPRVATRGAGTHGAYAYRTRLLDRPAAVTLELATGRGILHTVVVNWNLRAAGPGDGARLEATLVGRLTRSYGEPAPPAAGSLGGYRFQPGARQWSPGPDDRVVLETRAGVLQLRFVDLRRSGAAGR